MARRLAALLLLLAPVPLRAQARAAPASERVVPLSSLRARFATQGWGRLGIDRSVQDQPLRIGERSFEHGLGSHANGELVYLLGGGYSRLRAWVGVDAEVTQYPEASVTFRVLGDGKELFSSDVMRGDTPAARVDVDVRGVQVLRLVAGDGGDGIYADHADWADAELVGDGPAQTPPPGGGARYSVASGELTVELTDQGTLCALALGDARREVRGWTVPVGAGAPTRTKVEELPGGGVRATRGYTLDERRGFEVAESFRPLEDAVAWDLEVRSYAPDGERFTVPIETRMQWSKPASLRLWTASGGPAAWRDPLVAAPFGDTSAAYGAFYNRPNGLALPMVTVLDDALGRGVTLLQSPEDVLLELSLATTADGGLTWSHAFHRLGDPGRPLVFHRVLAVHPPDVRSALALAVERFPQFFEPPNPRAHAIGGGGAYSGYEGELDAKKLAAMAFSVNWKASMDFPYMGMFLPPVAEGEEWNRFAGGGGGRYGPEDEGRYGRTSFARMEAYNQRMHALGFHVLNYFNVTEFGGNIELPPAQREPDPSEPDWHDPNAFLQAHLAGAILRDPAPIWTWGGAVIMDCGEPAYRAFLLEQARRHLDELPSTDGICIDRMDWLARYDRHADDGVSWIDGPQRSLLRSWIELLDELGPMMHAAGKVVFVNDMVRRLELMRQVDGIYDEHGMWAFNLNTSAFLALRKPLICWTPEEATLGDDPDAYFQRHLYLGAFPTVPFPENDHTIRPSPTADAAYLAYGALFDALRGRRWVLLPDVVSVEGDVALANVFEVPGGFAVPVVLGGDSQSARVTLRGLPWGSPDTRPEAALLHPGADAPATITGSWEGGELRFDVPLVRGGALLLLR